MSTEDLTIRDVALQKAVSRRTVRRWVAAGVLPAYRVGPRVIRFRRDDVDGLAARIPTAEGE